LTFSGGSPLRMQTATCRHPPSEFLSGEKRSPHSVALFMASCSRSKLIVQNPVPVGDLAAEIVRFLGGLFCGTGTRNVGLAGQIPAPLLHGLASLRQVLSAIVDASNAGALLPLTRLTIASTACGGAYLNSEMWVTAERLISCRAQQSLPSPRARGMKPPIRLSMLSATKRQAEIFAVKRRSSQVAKSRPVARAHGSSQTRERKRCSTLRLRAVEFRR
jgi:hypothetical protein